ncbi:hypothetical protein ACFL6I_02010 [candidate division KSB1 bacterium]
MPTQKINNARPLTFLHNGKPVRPSRPSPPNREPSKKGVRFSGDVTYKEFIRNKDTRNRVTPQQLGQGAVRLQKSSGISLNITI